MTTLNLVEKAFFLKEVPLFSSANLDLLFNLAQHVGVLYCTPSYTLIEEGQLVDSLYFLYEGSLEILQKGQSIATISPSDFIGDEILMNQLPSQYSAICTTKSILLSLSKKYFYGVMGESPNIAFTLLRNYAETTPFRTRPKG